MAQVRAVAPNPPDFHLCSSVYGESLTYSACFEAATRLPGGSSAVEFSLIASPGHPISLPISLPYGRYSLSQVNVVKANSLAGECLISVEVAGPSRPATMNLVPNTIRSMAQYVIEECVEYSNGVGGFATFGIANLIDYVITHQSNPNLGTEFPTTTAFTTLTVSAETKKSPMKPGAGDSDPTIPLLIAEYMAGAAGMPMTGSTTRHLYRVAAQLWDICAVNMNREGPITWWQIGATPPASDDMIYECDAGLGSPSTVDCAQIEWNQLGPASVSPPSDTITVGPGLTHFLHQNTCFLAISATVNLVLNWAQIQAAVSALMNICVQNPVQPPTGGRAYYGINAPATRHRRRASQISGLNALPPGGEITFFRQDEPWKDQTTELKSCAWLAALSGKAVSTCK